MRTPAVIFGLLFSVFIALQASAEDLLSPPVLLSSEPVQCRYQLRNDGYSQPMPFTLESKVTVSNNQRTLEVSLSAVSRFFSALNIQVRSVNGFQVLPTGMFLMQSSDMNVNSKVEILNRTIKLEFRDLDGKDWRSISCLNSNLNVLTERSMQALRLAQ